MISYSEIILRPKWFIIKRHKIMLTIGKIKIKYLALVLFLAGLGMFSTVMAQSIDPCNDWVVGYSPVVQD